MFCFLFCSFFFFFFVQIQTLSTPQTCMRTDLESDLRLGYVHLNRPSSTSQCPLKTARARKTPVHTHSSTLAPTKTYPSDNKGSRNVYIRKTDHEKFGYTAGWPACEVHRARLPMSGQEHTAECKKRPEDVMTTDASTLTRVRDLEDSGTTKPSSSSGSGQHKRVRFSDQEDLESKPDTEMQTGGQEAPVTRKRCGTPAGGNCRNCTGGC